MIAGSRERFPFNDAKKVLGNIKFFIYIVVLASCLSMLICTLSRKCLGIFLKVFLKCELDLQAFRC